jgi:hypothetical protein
MKFSRSKKVPSRTNEISQKITYMKNKKSSPRKNQLPWEQWIFLEERTKFFGEKGTFLEEQCTFPKGKTQMP